MIVADSSRAADALAEEQPRSVFERGFDRVFPVMPASFLPAMPAFRSLVDRLRETVDQETEALRSRTPIDFVEVNRRKSRGLLELSRAARSLTGQLEPQTAEGLCALRASLERNRDVLGVHLAAAQEIAAILGRAIRDAESDGTYSAALAAGVAS